MTITKRSCGPPTRRRNSIVRRTCSPGLRPTISSAYSGRPLEKAGEQGCGAGGAVGGDGEVVDLAGDLGGDRGGDVGGAGRLVVHVPAGPVAVEPVADMEVLLEGAGGGGGQEGGAAGGGHGGAARSGGRAGSTGRAAGWRSAPSPWSARPGRSRGRRRLGGGPARGRRGGSPP